MADDSDEEDEIVAEYPLYSSTTAALFKTETQDIRVVQLQYPLRPAWRSYDTENMSEVKYKPWHRLLTLKVQEDQPDQKATTKAIPLSGQGRVPEVPLCIMCKVEGCFVLIPINEVTQMRPDMSKFVQSAYVKDEKPLEEEDVDYKPPTAAKSAAKASTSKAKTTPKTVKVEVKKRETDRQIQMRTRSYTHWREQVAAEEAFNLKPHGLSSGSTTLTGAAKTIVQQYAGQVAMGVPRKEYLKYVTPAVYLQTQTRKREAATKDTSAAAAEATVDEPPAMDNEVIAAMQQAMEDLFADQAVVTMRDVRLWLQSYTANVKARAAALQTDSTLSNLLLGGGSVVEIRYVLNTEDDLVRKEIVNLLKVKPEGVKKADVMSALRSADISTTDHACSRALRTLCVAVGAVWHLKEGATFQKKI